MHVVTGGAYNGKSAWVKEHYRLEGEKHFRWIDACQDMSCPNAMSDLKQDLVIFEGIEQWVWNWIKKRQPEDPRDFGKQIIGDWTGWEQSKAGRTLVVIGVDISKGIVPMNQEMRLWRDVTGWSYQDLVKNCDRLDLIWYGIQKQLK
ncbi:bifunctional adenosylcobinamide kinase/adenosylcobinamide-phosphate guanylyltransferase [Virgibacillus ihumii]|uniref:bifunctional adenosylcobinamide kinase/adenosylcobinamide-phosphate guanylyltransferase n=1 Tax=Virgibacillus ihumii TaxID=2686091 RepID=UPI00157E2AC2|nr:bifunctional adenosylcobinamide kinase/adenosylcobinamide-phosphate guanylyltransferase [Virgibacillus ihumii]